MTPALHYVVTGGAGFIGSHLVDHLLAAGCRVTVVDDLSSGDLNHLFPDGKPRDGLTLLRRNLLDLQANEVLGHVHGVAHLAAIPSVSQSWSVPLLAHHANLTATLKVVDLVKSWGCKRIVFASSAAVYGDTQQLPIREAQPVCPISPYGLQKSCSEDYLALFSRQANLECIALRLFNVFGPRQSPDSEYSGVISIFARAALARQEIKIFGDGLQTRDFIFVKDVALAFHLALQATMTEGSLKSLNVGLGGQTAVKILATILIKLAKGDISRITYLPLRAGDIRNSCAETEAIRAFLNFTPAYQLDVGLAELMESLQSATT